jgi:hypothetical protein
MCAEQVLGPAGKNPAVSNAILKSRERGRSPTDPTREIGSLLMYSGGLDSTAILANLLTATRHRLHVHHIELKNFENRSEAENNAIRLIMDYCRDHYRGFTYSMSGHEFNLGLGGGVDTSLVLFTAGRVYTASGGGLNIVWTGHITPPTWETIEGAAALHAGFINKLRVPEWLRPLKQMSKKDIYQSMPPELARLCWSCRTPVYEDGAYRPCGECYTCRTIEQAGGEVFAQGGGEKNRKSSRSTVPQKNQGIIFTD